MKDCVNKNGIPFGLKDGMFYDVTKVERGKKCGCFCPACESALLARKGQKLRHHFAHISGSNCSNAVETSIHRTAKQIVILEKRVRVCGAGLVEELRLLSDWIRCAGRPPQADEWLFPPELKSFVIVEPEKSMTVSSTGERVIPDLICDKKFLIEFLVSHAVALDKQELLRHVGLPCIEIDLRPFIRDWLHSDRRRDPQPAMEQLCAFLFHSSENRKWLYDTRVSEWLDTHIRPAISDVKGAQIDLLSVEPAKPISRYY